MRRHRRHVPPSTPRVPVCTNPVAYPHQLSLSCVPPHRSLQGGSTRFERAGPSIRSASQPSFYRPPVGQWTPQTGLGTLENRFNDREYSKGLDARPPVFRVSGSSPRRKGNSFARTFAKHPEYKEDPWDPKRAAERERNANEKKKVIASTAFKPTTGDYDYRTTKNAAGPAAFATIYTSSITFRPRNFGR